MKDKLDLHIDQLVEELKPQKMAMSLKEFLVKFIILCLVLFIITLSFLPVKESIQAEFSNSLFYFETILWLISSCLAGYTAYSMTLPTIKTTKLKLISLLCFCALTLSVLLRMSYSSLGEDVVHEMQLWRGWCGGIIVIYGLLISAPIYYCMKQGLTNKAYIQSSLLLALAGGGSTSFLMQIVCDHNSSMHILLWHFTSIMTLFLIISLWFRKKQHSL